MKEAQKAAEAMMKEPSTKKFLQMIDPSTVKMFHLEQVKKMVKQVNTVEELKKEIKLIKERNKKVESDKSWEISLTRKIIIFGLTYIAMIVYFYAVNLPEPFLNSIVPALAFVISTLSLPYFKQIWIKHFYKE